MRPTLEQSVKNCILWEGPTSEKFVEVCLPWEGLHAGAGEDSEEDGVAETECDKLIAIPIPLPPAQLGGGSREFRSKLKPTKKGGVRGYCF